MSPRREGLASGDGAGFGFGMMWNRDRAECLTGDSVCPNGTCNAENHDRIIQSSRHPRAAICGKSLTDSRLLNTMGSGQFLPNPSVEGSSCRTVLLNHMNSISYRRDASGRPFPLSHFPLSHEFNILQAGRIRTSLFQSVMGGTYQDVPFAFCRVVVREVGSAQCPMF